jgi:peptidoglycan/xylan/chitin deacetylase (PgdA/CDA1 family)
MRKSLSRAKRILGLALAAALVAGLAVFAPPVSANVVGAGPGDVNSDGVINASDVTMLRRFIAQGNSNGLGGFSLANARVLGGSGTPGAAEVTHLRRFLAATNANDVRLGGVPGYFISITTDDGPAHAFLGQNTPLTADDCRGCPPNCNRNQYNQQAWSTIGFSERMLNHLRTINDRPNVVCGRNGVMACGPGVGCGTVCGTQSRAQISFYVNSQNNSAMASNPPQYATHLLRRILQEGHSLDNHTDTHPFTNTASRATVENHILNLENRLIQLTAGMRDFYGNTYTAIAGGSPHRSFAFRPPYFDRSPNVRGIDRNTVAPAGAARQDMPWMFSGLDTDDWRGHTTPQMVTFIRHGNAAALAMGCTCGAAGDCSFVSTRHNGSPYTGAANGNADGGVILIHDAGAVERTPSVDFVRDLVLALQPLGYHFVTTEQQFYYMNAEPEWLPSTGTGPIPRVNDWIIRDRGNYSAWRASLNSPPRIYRNNKLPGGP